ncbi:EAL domain-containing protein [bacterium]|nr:EAL domain-containing protein [bacterium]
MRKRSDIKLLAIDDDPVVLNSIAGYFEDSGYTVITAGNGQEGLDRFREVDPDIMLVDIRMPEINGLDVLATAAKENPETPIIMVSSTNTIQDAIEALRLHAWDFVTKPVYDMKVLEHSVEKALEKADLLRENRQNRLKLEEQTVALTVVNVQLQSEISEHERTFADLKKSEEKHRLLFDNIGAVAIYCDLNGRLRMANQEAISFYRLDPDRLSQKRIQDILPKDLSDVFTERFELLHKTGAGRQYEDEFRIDQKGYCFLTALQPVVDQNKVIIGIQAVSHDITNRKLAEEELKKKKDELADLNLSLEHRVQEQTEELAKKLITDELTGLFNKIKLDSVLHQNEELVLLLIGLDNFSQINTFYGFEAGDELLKKLGQFLHDNQPEHSLLFRRTSAEFVLLVRGTSMEMAGAHARELHRKVFNQNFVLGSGISIQATVTIVGTHGSGPDVLKQAHLGMIEAKRRGRNRVFILTQEMVVEERQKTNMHWMNRVRKALKHDFIIPFFQPIIDNRTGLITKYECLSRMVENGEVVSPYLFLDAAKMVGMIHELTQVMIRKSVDIFKNTSFEFSINITEDDLKEGFLVRYMRSLFQEVAISPEQIVFEVLEGISVTDSDQVLEQLTALKEIGCKIAIDDFGAEQSNFSRLLELNADFIKIDGKFIKNIHTDVKSYTITKAITRLAKDIGTQVIAEFVHCEAVQEKICELEIDFSQGFYLGKPEHKIRMT